MSNYSDSEFVSHPNTPWYKVFNMIPPKAKVLDVGCSSGNFDKVLIDKKHCYVDGIELDTNDAKQASKILNHVYTLNIETDDISMLTDKFYDVIYFGDVIEHLVNPVKTLVKVKPKLASSGSIIFSIPNMTHISVRLMLIGGNFQYGKTGLLDNTHLHYYDLNEIKRLFSEAGFTITKLDWVKRDIPTELLKKQLKDIGLQAEAKFLKKSKELDFAAYQFVGKAQPSSKTAKPVNLPKVSPPIDEFERYLAGVRKDYENVINMSNDEIKRLQTKVNTLEDDLTTLNQSLSWKVTKPLRAGKTAIKRIGQKD